MEQTPQRRHQSHPLPEMPVLAHCMPHCPEGETETQKSTPSSLTLEPKYPGTHHRAPKTEPEPSEGRATRQQSQDRSPEPQCPCVGHALHPSTPCLSLPLTPDPPTGCDCPGQGSGAASHPSLHLRAWTAPSSRVTPATRGPETPGPRGPPSPVGSRPDPACPGCTWGLSSQLCLSGCCLTCTREPPRRAYRFLFVFGGNY